MVLTRLGLVLLMAGPAIALGGLWRRELLGAGELWVVVVIAAAAADALVGRLVSRVEVKREIFDPLSLGVRNPVALHLRNRSWLPQDWIVLDDLSDDLRPRGNRQQVRVGRYETATMRYWVRPRRRGQIELGDVWIRGTGPLRLARWQRQVKLGGQVRVYPNLAELRRYDYLARARRLEEVGYRTLRRRGPGREFESLREYVPDDDYRDIDWKATARRGRPITRQYEVERSQTLMLLIDCGRMMAAETQGLSKLDHAINAALMMAHVATVMDDAVGWIAFADRILRIATPRKSRDQVARLADELYELDVHLVEPDYVTAFAALKSRVRKRSLVVVFTDIVDLEASDRVVSYAASLYPQHLPLVAAIRDVEIEEAARRQPADEGEAFTAAVAARLLERRAIALASLRRRGALVIDVRPQELTPRTVSEYLQIKSSGRL